VAVHTGLRQGELLGLKWTDIDLEVDKLSVRQSLKVTDHGLICGPTKNKASRRSVPLNRSAVAALKTHRLRQNEERLRLGKLWADHDLVFPNRVGKPINPSNFYHREFRVLLQKSELEGQGFTFHSLRHTFATELFRRRMHPKVVQSLLGHPGATGQPHQLDVRSGGQVHKTRAPLGRVEGQKRHLAHPGDCSLDRHPYQLAPELRERLG
jgi:integrase